MLYNPRWSKDLTLNNFLAFVETRDPAEFYPYPKLHRCACGQWLATIGWQGRNDVGAWQLNEPVITANELARGDGTEASWTFGALAKRLRAYPSMADTPF